MYKSVLGYGRGVKKCGGSLFHTSQHTSTHFSTPQHTIYCSSPHTSPPPLPTLTSHLPTLFYTSPHLPYSPPRPLHSTHLTPSPTLPYIPHISSNTSPYPPHTYYVILPIPKIFTFLIYSQIGLAIKCTRNSL